ncbi:hypothetical protein [Rhizobium rhizosphaerae]|nr:hypothetical protein [Xaviernesmea rhizosphaerae]
MVRRPLIILLAVVVVALLAMVLMRGPGNMGRNDGAEQTQTSPHAINQSP